MSFAVRFFILVTTCLVLANCGGDGGSGTQSTGNSGSNSDPDQTHPAPAKSAISGLRQDQVHQVHTCLTSYRRRAGDSYRQMSGGYLMQCLLHQTDLRESDFDADFERDFLVLHVSLHAFNGQLIEVVDAESILKRINRGTRK